MNAIAEYPLTHALGWTLLHFCWQGAAVAGLLWCVLGALGRRSSQARYAAACFALALMAALPLFTFARLAVEDYRLAALHRAPIVAADLFVQAGLDGPAAPWPVRLSIALDHSMPWLLALWLLGVAFFIARLNFGLLAARRMRSAGTTVPSPDLLHLFAELRVRLGIHRVVRLLHSARVQVPTVIGWLCPVVLLPASRLSGLSPAQIEAILCHELAHIRRHDYLVSVMQSVVEAHLFYHPAVWWVSKQIRRERECCCDDLAVAHGGDVLAYARALSWLEEQRSCAPQLALGANGGVLKMRIQRLLGHSENSAASQVASIALLAVILLCGLAFAGRLVYAEARAAQTASSPEQISFPPAATAATPNAAAERQLRASAEKKQSTPHGAPQSSDEAQLLAHQYAAQAKRDAQKPASHAKLYAQETTPPAPPSPASTAAASVPAAVIQQNRLTHPNPVYPPIAKAAHVQGVVVLHARISKEGNVEQLNIVSGPPMLTAAAIDAVRQWTYKPYLQHGQPSEVDTTINVNFTFGGDGPPSRPDGTSASVHILPRSPTDSAGNPLRTIGGEVSAPLIIYQVEPEFSAEARQAKAGGSVLLGLIVNQQGHAEDVHVVRGVGMGLDEKAVEAVRQYRFRPAMENGQPVPVELNVEINFKIMDKPKPERGPSVEGGVSGDAVRKIGGGVSAPQIVHQVEPEYTPEARKAKFSGPVLVGCIVNEKGQPEDVHVVRGVGMGLDEKAIEAVKQYKFKPAIENGQPVPVELNIEVNFQIF